ncbi:MAG TPA: nicotinamide riboside transporter PnuC [Bacteroidia bacterium]|jgi:nicotinamide mononucleotide transporter
MDLSEISSSLISASRSTGIIEWLIFITALLYVFLAARENAWCWLFGMLSSAFSVYLCFEGKLFLESGLNIFYVIIGAYGWHQWRWGSKEKQEARVVSSSLKSNLIYILIAILIWLPLGLIAHKFSTQVMPYLDAFITAFSIIATWMTAKKILENWLYWIVIDAFAVILYSYRGFYLLGLLYIIYTLLAAAGYFSWKRKTL